jgi:dolichyl-phosphate-mannose-protein mannosyltransferase
LIALLFCFWNRTKPAIFSLVFYFAFVGCWLIIPRKIMFYYYYFPAFLILGVAITAALSFLKDRFSWGRSALWAVVVLNFCFFIYFFKVLSGLPIKASDYIHYMWMMSWI